MIAFDTFLLSAVASEIRSAARGARVQKIQQPADHDLVLAVYGRSGAQRILLSADPQAYRVHLNAIRREAPVTPPGFCQVCRKYLDGAILEAVTLPRFDRILHLAFRAFDGEHLTLIAELMGRNANLILVSGTGAVRGLIRPTPPGSPRPLRPGATYTPPPGFDARPDPSALSEEDLNRHFSENCPDPTDRKAVHGWLTGFSGISGFGADEILARAEAPAEAPHALAELMTEVRERRFAPHSVADETGHTIGVWAFAPQSVEPGRRSPRTSVSEAVETFYASRIRASGADAERQEIARTLQGEIAYRRKEIASAEATLDEADRAGDYERMANLLLAHLAQVPRGAESVTVPDLYDAAGREATIQLDAKRSPSENAEAYFDRARRARDAAEYAAGRVADLHAELTELTALEEALERARDSDDFGRIREALAGIVGEKRARPEKKQAPPNQEKPFGGHRIRTVTVEGYDLLIGETAEANDHLTTRVAAPSDLWLHVRAGTGAHGILRTGQKGGAVPESVLRRAAEIVAARSGTSVKHASVVAVDVVEKRHVRKPRGARPGFVTYTRERTLDVTPRL